MNLFIVLCTVQIYLKFKLSFFINKKKYFKKIHGQHENSLLEIQLLKITSPKRPILKEGPYFIFWRSAAWCRAVSNFLSLLCSWTLITEQRDLQECCNYISKDGLSDKGTINEQWKFNQLWPIHYQAWGKIQTLSTAWKVAFFSFVHATCY